MIYKLYKNGEEISFANVDTIEEAADLLLDPYGYQEVQERLEFTAYYAVAHVNGDTWEIKGDYIPEPAGGFKQAPAVKQFALDCGCLIKMTGTHARIITECRYHSPLSHR